jgi:hypothetical protein
MTFVGTTNMVVNITDTKDVVSYTFKIIVTNLAPIVTSAIPTDITVQFGSSTVYTLPTSKDPEGLPYFTYLDIGPPFI